MIRPTRYSQFSTINVTNLVDVTMTLLVVFMLAGPVMHRCWASSARSGAYSLASSA